MSKVSKYKRQKSFFDVLQNVALTNCAVIDNVCVKIVQTMVERNTCSKGPNYSIGTDIHFEDKFLPIWLN